MYKIIIWNPDFFVGNSKDAPTGYLHSVGVRVPQTVFKKNMTQRFFGQNTTHDYFFPIAIEIEMRKQVYGPLRDGSLHIL